PLASGANFPVGTTEVRCTATDPAGNSSSCIFNVTVNDLGCSLDANSPAPVPNVAQLPTITRSCSVTLMAADDPTAADACGRTITGTTPERVFDVPGNYTLVWTYTDSAGHTTTQNQSVIIPADNSAPVPDAASLPTVTGECSAAITGDPPTATDNCGGSDIAGTPLDPLSYNTPGSHTVRWKFTDAAGNFTIQNQTVIVTDSAPPVPNVASLPTLTGECSVTVTPPTATDNCAGSITGVTPDPTTYTAEGTYTVHWTYTDAAGNSATQNQTVIVDDTTAPVPDVASLPTVTGECSATVTAAPTATDNCAGAITATTSDPTTYTAQGTFTIHWTYNDGRGNSSTQNQTVIVHDTTPPTLNAPNIVVSNDAGSCSAVVNFTGLSASDNCGTANINTSIASGSTFPKGTTTVNVTVTDGHGNTTTGSFTVTVNDTEFPVVNVPANIVAYLPLHSTATSMAVSYSVTATDNCGVQSLVVSPTSGSVFPVGTTTVTATATDTSGNVTTRTFTVTVLYDFTGFFSPVANTPTVNAVNAGRAIPVKFSLSGSKGLNIFAADSPSSSPYTCGNVSTVDVSQTVDATSNSINYDAGSDQYNYVWKTDSSWAGQCRTLTVTLNDGSTHTALFKFR
ncbi:MAG TPA: HYR domain-containing protein, partial [Mycobacteriales bacterium]|nr:HYR domain-containing protein [Mycobacteriales bacterium]